MTQTDPAAPMAGAGPSSPQLPGVQLKAGIPRWVRVLAVIVTTLEMLYVLFVGIFAVLLGAVMGAGGFAAVAALMLVVAASVVGFQGYAAITNRRRGLQIASGVLSGGGALGLIGYFREMEPVVLAIVAVALGLQLMVFVGSLIIQDS